MDRSQFEELVAPHRKELHAHCYRMLGSVHDADDALQDALLGAWRGRDTFAGKSSLRAWLFRIATNACLHLIAQRPRRLLSADYQRAASGTDIEAMLLEPIWLEPYPDDPEARVEQREQVELAFVAALQHLPGTQRAVLLVRDVLGFSAEETAGLLEVTVATVNSALQRARASIAERVPARSQQATLHDLGEPAQRALVASFVSAWGRADVDALLALLASDARFMMPPIPTWFDGIDAIRGFVAERMFQTPWHLVPMRASGQLAFACYQGPEPNRSIPVRRAARNGITLRRGSPLRGPAFRLGAFAVVTVRGQAIAQICGFLDPAVHARFSIPTDEFRRPADSYGT